MPRVKPHHAYVTFAALALGAFAIHQTVLVPRAVARDEALASGVARAAAIGAKTDVLVSSLLAMRDAETRGDYAQAAAEAATGEAASQAIGAAGAALSGEELGGKREVREALRAYGDAAGRLGRAGQNFFGAYREAYARGDLALVAAADAVGLRARLKETGDLHDRLETFVADR